MLRRPVMSRGGSARRVTRREVIRVTDNGGALVWVRLPVQDAETRKRAIAVTGANSTGDREPGRSPIGKRWTPRVPDQYGQYRLIGMGKLENRAKRAEVTL